MYSYADIGFSQELLFEKHLDETSRKYRNYPLNKYEAVAMTTCNLTHHNILKQSSLDHSAGVS